MRCYCGPDTDDQGVTTHEDDCPMHPSRFSYDRLTAEAWAAAEARAKARTTRPRKADR